VMNLSSSLVAPKLLISMDGVDSIIDIVEALPFNSWARGLGVQVIAFTSSKGYYVNGLEKTRREALDRLRGLEDDDSAIILHYDILTEGIDLPNITGIMPLRELNKVKFLQTCGRAARLQDDDRTKNYADGSSSKTLVSPEGEVHPSGQLLKPVFWVLQTPLLKEEASKTNQTLIDVIRTEYQVDPDYRSISPTSTSGTEGEVDSLLEPVAATAKERKRAQYRHEFEALIFLHSMRSQDQKKLLDDILKGMKPLGEIDEQEATETEEATTPETEEGEGASPEGEAKPHGAEEPKELSQKCSFRARAKGSRVVFGSMGL
jgi:superfamily II DNA or RNA helicase